MKKFKNDRERKSFLDNYRSTDAGWILWKDDQDLERRWWRLQLTDSVAFIVEEEHLTYAYPERHDSWTARHWYITDRKVAEYTCGNRDPHFGDYRASKSEVLAFLKEVEKSDG